MSSMTRLIIAGSRTVEDMAVVENALQAAGASPERVQEVVSGGARGVDRLGERWAERHGIKIKHFIADWHKHGRAAGPKRNAAMAVYATHLVAVWDGQSRGTRNMIDMALASGLRVFVYRTDAAHAGAALETDPPGSVTNDTSPRESGTIEER